MPELPLATETDTGRPLGSSVAAGTLPAAVDDSLQLVVETETVPGFIAVSNPGAYPGTTTLPGDTLYPGAPYEVLAANVATGTLPTAVEADTPRPLTYVAEKPLPAATQQDMALPLTVLVDNAMFADAIEGVDRTPAFTLKADWGRTGLFDHEFSDLTNLVEEVTVDRTLTGELPPEVGLVDGTTSATMSVQLAGRWDRNLDDHFDPVDVFAPYRADSPLYGKPILQSPLQLETGFITATGPRLDRRFTGTVARINPVSSDRTVELTGLDASHRLRENITLPGTAMYGDLLHRHGPDSYRGRFNSQWLIDHILRRNGIYASPPARPDAILSVTGHGSMVPEIGWGGAPVDVHPHYRGAIWVPGPFGVLAYNVPALGRWWLEEELNAAPGTGFGMSMWMSPYDAIPGDVPGGQWLSIDVTADASLFLQFGTNTIGQPYFGFYRKGSGETRITATSYSAPPFDQWRFVGVHVSFAATTMTVRFRLGNQIHTGTATIGTRAANWRPGVSIDYALKGSVNNLQLWRSATPPGAGQWQGETWIPQADLDPGINELTGIPQIVGEDSMELIKEICAAEGSTFEFTEEGRPRFRTRIGDAARGEISDITERITADRNLADLVSTTDEASVRNIINVKTKTLTISDWQNYYVANDRDAFYTPAQSTSYFELELPTAAYEIPPPLSTFGCRPFAPYCWNEAGGTGFIFFGAGDNWSANSENSDNIKQFIRVQVRNADVPTEWVGQGVQIRVVRLTPWKMQVIINNQNNHGIQFSTPRDFDTEGNVTDEGEPALIIPARIIEQGEEQLKTHIDHASVQLYGPSSYDVGSSGERWRQTVEGLDGLATSVLAATARPVPVLDAVDVPHDPRRRLRSRVVLEDPDGLGEVAATIVGLSTTYTNGPAVDQITVRPIAPPGLGLLGDSTVGLLGINLVLG